jgi:hypothetical protein
MPILYPLKIPLDDKQASDYAFYRKPGLSELEKATEL